MIYIFTGNLEILKNEALNKWKNQFIEKYSDFNLFHFKNLENIKIEDLYQSIISEWFFSEKKLIIIDISDKSSEKESKKDKILDSIKENILKSLEKISENNIVIINYTTPDKRKSFWKNLIKIWELKEFNIKNDEELKNFINSKYSWKIDNYAIEILINYKSKNPTKIIQEIEKLLILKDFIKREDIEKNIIPELEEDIFNIINLLLNKEKIQSIEKIWIILEQTNIFAFYNSLLSNLRTNLFILKLKNENISQTEISNILWLWNRSFLVWKNYKITFKELRIFYINLVEIDKNMKTWKLIKNDLEDIKFEIEKCILKI